jgi:hypothetical protein
LGFRNLSLKYAINLANIFILIFDLLQNIEKTMLEYLRAVEKIAKLF